MSKLLAPTPSFGHSSGTASCFCQVILSRGSGTAVLWRAQRARPPFTCHCVNQRYFAEVVYTSSLCLTCSNHGVFEGHVVS